MAASCVMILGGPNTGTSSLVGVLNSHSRALVLYETDLNAIVPSKYARRLVGAVPSLRACIREHTPAVGAYVELARHAREHGHDFVLVGDKLPHFNQRTFDRFRDFKIIYSYRDAAEWLAKASASLEGEADVRPLFGEYLGGYLRALSSSNCLVVPFETFLADNRKVVSDIFKFVGLQTEPQCFEWWKTVGKYSDQYRSSQRWWSSHGSSLVEPRRNDTKIMRRCHAAWAVIDSAFDCAGQALSETEQDLVARVNVFMKALGPMPIRLDQLMSFETRRVAVKKRTLKGLVSSLLRSHVKNA